MNVFLTRVIGFCTMGLIMAGWNYPKAAEALPLAELVNNLAMAQHRGGWFRDRSIYFQKLDIERFKNRIEKGSNPTPFYHRLSVAEVSADDNGEVIARLVSDTDADLKPKTVKASSRNVFGAPLFLEKIFFPLYPERVVMYEIIDLGTTLVNTKEARMLRLFPKVGYEKEPLVEGVFYVDPTNGVPLRLVLEKLHHFETMEPRLAKLLEFRCETDFLTLPNGVIVPCKARGGGYSEISRYDGYFRFTFDEWGYRPNRLYPDVNPYFEKMQDYRPEIPSGIKIPEKTEKTEGDHR